MAVSIDFHGQLDNRSAADVAIMVKNYTYYYMVKIVILRNRKHVASTSLGIIPERDACAMLLTTNPDTSLHMYARRNFHKLKLILETCCSRIFCQISNLRKPCFPYTRYRCCAYDVVASTLRILCYVETAQM